MYLQAYPTSPRAHLRRSSSAPSVTSPPFRVEPATERPKPTILLPSFVPLPRPLPPSPIRSCRRGQKNVFRKLVNRDLSLPRDGSLSLDQRILAIEDKRSLTVPTLIHSRAPTPDSYGVPDKLSTEQSTEMDRGWEAEWSKPPSKSPASGTSSTPKLTEDGNALLSLRTPSPNFTIRIFAEDPMRSSPVKLHPDSTSHTVNKPTGTQSRSQLPTSALGLSLGETQGQPQRHASPSPRSGRRTGRRSSHRRTSKQVALGHSHGYTVVSPELYASPITPRTASSGYTRRITERESASEAGMLFLRSRKGQYRRSFRTMQCLLQSETGDAPPTPDPFAGRQPELHRLDEDGGGTGLIQERSIKVVKKPISSLYSPVSTLNTNPSPIERIPPILQMLALDSYPSEPATTSFQSRSRAQETETLVGAVNALTVQRPPKLEIPVFSPIVDSLAHLSLTNMINVVQADPSPPPPYAKNTNTDTSPASLTSTSSLTTPQSGYLRENMRSEMAHLANHDRLRNVLPATTMPVRMKHEDPSLYSQPPMAVREMIESRNGQYNGRLLAATPSQHDSEREATTSASRNASYGVEILVETSVQVHVDTMPRHANKPKLRDSPPNKSHLKLNMDAVGMYPAIKTRKRPIVLVQDTPFSDAVLMEHASTGTIQRTVVQTSSTSESKSRRPLPPLPNAKKRTAEQP